MGDRRPLRSGWTPHSRCRLRSDADGANRRLSVAMPGAARTSHCRSTRIQVFSVDYTCQRSFNRQSTAFVMRGLRVRLPPLALIWSPPKF